MASIKYIKTPTGIYDVETKLFQEFTSIDRDRTNIIKKVDSCEEYSKYPERCKAVRLLEDLPDYFVCASKEEGNDFRCLYKTFIEMLSDSFYTKARKYYNFYGAVWTPRGLCYIAKMSADGYFELL